jgi:DUF971 family protein
MTVVRAPEAINYSQSRRILTISFPESDPVELSAELLRVLSPSAEVQGHGPGQEVLQTGKQGVSITDMQPIGHYAVQLSFDDGHSSGLYTWAYLAQLAENKDTLWADYLMKLARAGESRDPDTNIVKILG